MKKLWKRGLGMIKDRNSLWVTKMLRNSRHRNPSLESSIIKSTSHDDTFIDYNNAQRVFTWVRASSSHLSIFLRCLTRRVERTQDWTVALKCLMLIHGVLCTKAPGTRRIGRLPFDLTSFEDAFTRRDPTRLHSRNAFVRAYFSFSDSKSVAMAVEMKEEESGGKEEEQAKAKLIRVSRWQNLMDELMQVKPQGNDMLKELLVTEAMDCMIIEVFELYSKICDGIAKALMMIHTDDIDEATLALNVLQKASKQGEQLSDYFEFCRKIGILHSSECPRIEKIPREDFVELERIINGRLTSSPLLEEEKEEEQEEANDAMMISLASSSGCCSCLCSCSCSSRLKTLITDKWEVFEEDIIEVGLENEKRKQEELMMMINPFANECYNQPPLIQFNPFVDYGGNAHILVSFS